MSRALRIDGWGPVMAVLGGVVFVLHGVAGALTRDASIYAYAGQQVAEGVPPYVQILPRAGPLAHLGPGAAAAAGRAVGVDDLLAMRVAMAALSALALWVAYLWGRDLCASRFAGVVAASVLLSFQGFVTYATDGPREKTTMVLFVLLTLWATCRRHWPGAGAATALATLTWQGSFFPVTAVVLVAALALPGWAQRLRALTQFAVAGLAVTAVTVLYFAAVGALPELYEGFVAVSAGYADPTGLLTMLRKDPDRLVTGFGWSLPLVVAGVVASVALAGVRLRHLDRRSPGEVATVALGVGTLVNVGWALTSFEGWPDVFPFLPFAAAGLAGLAHLLVSRVDGATAVRVGGGVVALLVVATAATAFLDRSSALHSQRRHVTASLAALDHPDLLAVSNPTPLVLARQRNPIRYQLFVGAQRFYLNATLPGGLAGLGREVGELAPTVITVFGRPQQWLRPVLEQDYVRVGPLKPNAWYVSTDATTEAQRAELRRVVSTLGRVRRPDVRPSLS